MSTAGTPRTVAYGYTNGLLTSVGETGHPYASSIGYHPNTMLKSIAHGNGVTVTHGLDPHAMRRPASIATSGVTGTPGNWDSGTYGYDGAGNITRVGQWHYTYDPVSRLTGGWNPRLPDPPCPPLEICYTNDSVHTFSYDPFANLTSWAWFEGDAGYGASMPTATATNRVSDAGYDSAGSMTSWNGTATGWCALNDLRSVVGLGVNDLYGYTVDGERLVSLDQLSQKFTMTLRDLGGKALRSFEVTPGTPGAWTEKQDWIYRDGQLLATIEGGVEKHFHLDHLGSPRQVTGASGQGLSATEFHPFGWDVRTMAQSTARMQFTGHERDVHLTTHSSDDLYYLHARYYNPTVGRFLSTDPLRGSATSPQSFNLYGYVRSNPINFIDPWGLAAEVVSCDGGGYCGSITVTAGDSVSEIAGRIRLEWLLARMRRERERLENERRNLRYIQANDFYLIRIAEQGKRPCSKSFSERFLNGFSATNGLPGLVAPAGAGLFTTKTIAKGLGLPTLRQFARGGLRGLTVGGEALGGVEAGAAAGSASVASFAYVGAAWEVGVTAGSAIAVSWDGVPCDF